MQARGLTIPTTFTAVDQFSTAVRGMSRTLHDFSSTASTASTNSARGFRNLVPALGEVQGQILNIMGTIATVDKAVELGKFSVQSVMDYETAVQSLQAVTGVTSARMEDFKLEINSVATTSKKSAIEVTKSFETIGSAMSQYLDDPKSLRMIADAGITLSRASRMELEPSLVSLTSVMNQFGIKAEGAANVVNRLTAGEIVGSIRTAEAANYLQEFGGVAKNMNVTVAESTALIEALGIQMDKTKIGVGARNILTILSAAGGLDKKARKDLRKSGVDIKYLMDNTKSLSERLHELGKIAKDPIKMVSVFGRENLTAGQVIFQQLAKYDEYINKINSTNKANEQATLNTSTLSQALERLSNSWVNQITGSEKTASALKHVTDVVNYLSDNMGSLINIVATATTAYIAYRAAVILTTAASWGINAAIGIGNALFTTSTVLTYQNVIAQRAYLTTSKLVGGALNILAGDFTAFNAILLANPVGIVVTGLVALVGIMYLVSKRVDELNEKYKEQIRIDQAKRIQNETSAVKQLAMQYWKLGDSMDVATEKAIKFRLGGISMQRSKVEQRIKETKSQLESEKNKIYLADLFYNGGTPEVGRRKDLAEQLLAQQTSARILSDQFSAEMGFTKEAMGKGIISSAAFSRILPRQEKAQTQSQDPYFIGSQRPAFDFFKFAQGQGTTITIKNESNNEAVIQTPGKSRSVMPSTTSTLAVKK